VIGGEGTLPRTGDPSIPLVVLGALLIVTGLGLIVLGQFRTRRLHG
jgi:LPXTG-motif cell wall-anchored protein